MVETIGAPAGGLVGGPIVVDVVVGVVTGDAVGCVVAVGMETFDCCGRSRAPA